MNKLYALTGTIALVITLLLQSCGGGMGTNSPGATVKKAFELIAGSDYEKAVDTYTKKDGTAFTEEERTKVKGLLAMGASEIEKKGGIKSMEILEEKISDDGTTATVKWKITYGNGETDNSDGELIKVDGKWKMKISN